MKIDFINYNGIEQYARVMYNDVKDSDKYKVEVAYNGKDIKALLEYLFDLEQRIDKAIEYGKTTLKFARLEKDFEKEKILLNFLEILGDKEDD